jgi:hypothetical protein
MPRILKYLMARNKNDQNSQENTDPRGQISTGNNGHGFLLYLLTLHSPQPMPSSIHVSGMLEGYGDGKMV